MQGRAEFQLFAGAGLELLGIAADDAELGVMQAADSIYRTHIEALLEADLDGVAPEPEIDVSAPPRP